MTTLFFFPLKISWPLNLSVRSNFAPSDFFFTVQPRITVEYCTVLCLIVMLHMHNMYSPVLVNLCFCLSLSKAYRKNELTKSPKEAEFQLKMSRSSKGAADRNSSWKGRLNSAYVLQLDSMPLTPPHLLPLTAHKFHGLTTNGYPCHLSHFCLCLTK